MAVATANQATNLTICTANEITNITEGTADQYKNLAVGTANLDFSKLKQVPRELVLMKFILSCHYSLNIVVASVTTT
jgi:hypothetical protein